MKVAGKTKALFIAGFGPIVSEAAISRKLYGMAAGGRPVTVRSRSATADVINENAQPVGPCDPNLLLNLERYCGPLQSPSFRPA
jgi:hypothetical protein